MPIEFVCPSCQRQYQVKDELAGRNAKCGQCGHRMPIPQVASASAMSRAARGSAPSTKGAAPPKRQSGSGGGSWLDEELEASQSKVVRPPVASLAPCPGCGKALANGAVVCVACGYDTRTHKKLETMHDDEIALVGKRGTQKRTKVSFGLTMLRGAVLSFLGAMLGGFLWAVVAYLTWREFGIIAWGVGGLAGLGMALGHDDDDGTLAGIVAAFMSLLGIVAAKVFIVLIVIGMAVAAAVNDLDAVNGADAVGWKRALATGAVAGDTLEAKGIDPENATEAQWAEATREAEVEVARLSEAELDARLEQIAQEEEVLHEEAAEVADPEAEADKIEIAADVPADVDEDIPSGVGELIGAMFSPIDGLWILLAFFTAYKVGSGQATD